MAGLRQGELGHLAQPVRADRRQVGGGGQRAERLVGADVRGRLLAPDVLLASLEGQDVSLAALGVPRRPDQAAGHLAHRGHLRRHEPDVRPPEADRDAERLPLGGDDVGPIAPGAARSASEVGSTTATSWAPAACARSASSDIGSSWPRQVRAAAP